MMQVDQIRRRNGIIYQAIIDKDFSGVETELDKINRFFLEMYTPKVFNSNDPKSLFIQMDNHFEEVCFVLENNGVTRPQDVSIFQFTKKLDFVEEKINKQNELNKPK